MNTEQIVTIVSNLLTSTGVATYVYFLVKGLRNQIGALKGTVEAQKQTLEVMKEQVAETEKIGNMYKKLTSDFPEIIEQYQKFVQVTKDKIIEELKTDNQVKDEKLKESRTLELKQLELYEQFIAELPSLQQKLVANIEAIQERFGAMDHVIPVWSQSLGQSKVEFRFARTYRTYIGDKGQRVLLDEDELTGTNRQRVLRESEEEPDED